MRLISRLPATVATLRSVEIRGDNDKAFLLPNLTTKKKKSLTMFMVFHCLGKCASLARDFPAIISRCDVTIAADNHTIKRYHVVDLPNIQTIRATPACRWAALYVLSGTFRRVCCHENNRKKIYFVNFRRHLCLSLLLGSLWVTVVWSVDAYKVLWAGEHMVFVSGSLTA